MPCCCSRAFLCTVVVITVLHSWAAQEPNSSPPTFKVKAHLVLLDVTVSDASGHPTTGLLSNDFEIVENGRPQTIDSFEEYQDHPSATVAQHSLLPAHFYTNAPLVRPSGSINVLLLDSLNTEYGDQATVRLQMINYLKAIDPGPQLAIFTLGSRLRMVEGFTSDPKALIETLNHKQWAGTPETSDQQSSTADNLDQATLTRMTESGTVPGEEAAIEALQGFLADVKRTETLTRMSSTLQALQELSRYVSGFHGRKNIIWFAGSFPQVNFPAGGEATRVDLNSDNGLSEELRDTINMLAGAQIAVYPIAAQGLETQGFYEAANLSGRARGLQSPGIEGQNQSLRNENVGRYFNQKAADDIALNTGGQAFYNTNGLKEALDEAVHRGAYFYRLSYSPTDKRMQGRYRHIEVRLKKRRQANTLKVAYRRGYYEESEKMAKAVTTDLSADLLKPLMERGLPNATELIYDLRVLRSGTQPTTGAPPLGDNNELHGPVTRIAADFVIPVDTLDFELTSDDVRHGNLELALVAYDRTGKPLNWIVRSLRTALKPEVYPSVQKTGIQFHQELDVPTMDLYLRTGIYDLRSNKAGTLEIPLSNVAVADIVSTGVPKPASAAPSAAPLGSTSEATPASNRSPTPSPNDTNSGTGAAATTLEPTHQVPQASLPPLQEPSTQEAKDLESTIHAYCARLSPTIEHSSALANICEFALSIRKRFPDLICDREMKRYWTEYRATWAGGNGVGAFDEVKHSDLLTAKVAYRDGREYYDQLRLDGKLVSPEASVLPPPSLSGPWSVGEFAMVLEAVFLPSSKAEFQFKKQTHIGSARGLMFTFHVAAANNHSYFLFVQDKQWFPEYGGQLWIDENGFHILRLTRETAYMKQYPIRSAKTTIEYAPISLADNSTLVLPINSEVMTCEAPVRGNSDNCSRSLVKFTNWHKFRATTNIVTNPER